VRIDMDLVTKEVTMDRVSPRPLGKINNSIQRSKPPISEKRKMAKSISVKQVQKKMKQRSNSRKYQKSKTMKKRSAS
jgi:hypothetical protein